MSDGQSPAKDPKTGRFVTGNIGGGRNKGSRNALGEAFTHALYADFTKANEDGVEQGAAVIAKLRDTDPGAYVRVVAGLLPKELVVKDELSEVSDEELAALVAAAREALSHRANGGSEASTEGGSQQAPGVSTLQ